MASTSETGHSKNVANMDALASFTLGYGPVYNPTKTSLKSDALIGISADAKKAITDVNLTLPLYSNAVAAREQAFLPLSKLVTRILSALKATDTASQVIDNAKTLIRKITGQRATPKKTIQEKKVLQDAGQQVNEISAYQMSYNSRLENLDKLISLLATVPSYSPNEKELSIEFLTLLCNELKTKNGAVINTTIPLSKARLVRNNILYREDTGLVDTAMDAKSYIKSVFGASSPEYKLVSRLTFTNYLA